MIKAHPDSAPVSIQRGYGLEIRNMYRCREQWLNPTYHEHSHYYPSTALSSSPDMTLPSPLGRGKYETQFPFQDIFHLSTFASRTVYAPHSPQTICIFDQIKYDPTNPHPNHHNPPSGPATPKPTKLVIPTNPSPPLNPPCPSPNPTLKYPQKHP